MGELMHDALGVGLAATQIGILHRMLVYRAYPDDPLTVLVNPELEWASDELETGRRGMPQPARRPRRGRAPGGCSGTGQGRARPGAADRGGGSGRAGDPARDGPPRRDPDPRPDLPLGAQGGDAGDARGSEVAQRRLGGPGRRALEHRLSRDLGLRRGDTRSPRRRAAHRPSLVITRPDRPVGRGRRLLLAAGGRDGPRASGWPSSSPPRSTIQR